VPAVSTTIVPADSEVENGTVRRRRCSGSDWPDSSNSAGLETTGLERLPDVVRTRLRDGAEALPRYTEPARQGSNRPSDLPANCAGALSQFGLNPPRIG
jgi:hypothetical protein